VSEINLYGVDEKKYPNSSTAGYMVSEIKLCGWTKMYPTSSTAGYRVSEIKLYVVDQKKYLSSSNACYRVNEFNSYRVDQKVPDLSGLWGMGPTSSQVDYRVIDSYFKFMHSGPKGPQNFPVYATFGRLRFLTQREHTYLAELHNWC